MKTSFFLTLLMVAQAAIAMPRNPFLPPEAPCGALTDRLAKWTLYGVIDSKAGSIAIMQDPQKRWRRINAAMSLESTAPVYIIKQRLISVTLPRHCGQALYSWTIKGASYGMEANVNSAGDVAPGKPR